MRKFSEHYFNKLFASRGYEGLVELSAAVCASSAFRPLAPDCGLPLPAFLLVESLVWFAQATRSGAWTYFEATPGVRQQAMLAALRKAGPKGFAEQYSIGMWRWKDAEAMKSLDVWMEQHDEENNAWLWALANANRPIIEEVCA